MIEPVEREQTPLFASFEYAREWGAQHVQGFPGWRVVPAERPRAQSCWVIELVPGGGPKRFYPSEEAERV
jgi:hypothetical protein